MSHRASSSLAAIVVVALLGAVAIAPAAAAPAGQLTWAVHTSLAPTWFDPAEPPSLITPFMVLYAMHDALVKFMPGAPQGKSLAEAWSVGKDGLFSEQVNEQNPRVRTQILHKIQQILHDRVMFAPVLEPAFLNGVGPRVATSGLGVIANFPYSAPYEDLALKAK